MQHAQRVHAPLQAELHLSGEYHLFETALRNGVEGPPHHPRPSRLLGPVGAGQRLRKRRLRQRRRHTERFNHRNDGIDPVAVAGQHEVAGQHLLPILLNELNPRQYEPVGPERRPQRLGPVGRRGLCGVEAKAAVVAKSLVGAGKPIVQFASEVRVIDRLFATRHPIGVAHARHCTLPGPVRPASRTPKRAPVASEGRGRPVGPVDGLRLLLRTQPLNRLHDLIDRHRDPRSAHGPVGGLFEDRPHPLGERPPRGVDVF
jgi:hypothetical protein